MPCWRGYQADVRWPAALPIFVACWSDRLGHNVTASPTKKTATSAKNKMDCLSHDTTGTAKASTRPKKHIGSSDKLSPARKVPSASKSKSAKLVAGVGNNCWTPDNNMMFMATKTATQWTDCVHINRTRACLSLRLGHSAMTQTRPVASAKNSQ